MTADQILVGDLGLDALEYIKRVVASLDMEQRAIVAMAFSGGAPFELRIRMWSTGREPKFTLLLIADGSEIELQTMGGQP